MDHPVLFKESPRGRGAPKFAKEPPLPQPPPERNCETTDSVTTLGSPPLQHHESQNYWMAIRGSRPKERKGECAARALHYIIDRGRMRTRRRQADHETTKTGVATTMVCHRMCDYHHYSPKEEERDCGHYHRSTGTRRRVPLRHNDEDDCYGYYHAGSTTGEVINQETNDIVGLRHQTD